MKGKKILVTGASGFVGFSLALELAKSNEVHGMARFRDESVKRLLEDVGVTTIAKNARDRLDDVPVDYDYVFNELGMVPNHPSKLHICEDFPDEAFRVNARFVGDLMEHCATADGVILASTGGVYKPSGGALKEDGPLLPIDTYGLTKLCGEVLGSYVSEKLNVPTCILRYFYPYGPGVGSILATWADMIREGVAIPFNRAMVPHYNPHFIHDCVKLTIEAARLCKIPPTVLNVAGTEIKSKVELLDLISEAMGVDYRIENDPHVPPYLWAVGDVSVMLKSLGEPKVKLKEGIGIMVKQRYSDR